MLRSDWRGVLHAYRHPLMLQVLLNGIISGLPWAMFGSLLSLWLQSAGYSRSQIGAFGIIGLAYTLNLLWAPLVDTVKPFRRPGMSGRHAWILVMQCVILLCMLSVAALDIHQHIVPLAVLMVIAAFAGATQDVAIDAVRIELTRPLGHKVLAAGAAVTTMGWWSGYGLGGALSIGSLEWLGRYFPEHHWQMSYLLLALLWLSCLGAQLYTVKIVSSARMQAEPHRDGGTAGDLSRVRPGSLLRLYLDPIRSFLNNYGLQIGAVLLAIIFFFKIGEAFLGRMSIVFYGEYFSKGDIALYSKGLGAISYCLFAFVGSLISARYGLLRGIIIGGILMAGTNLLFALLAYYPGRALFAFSVVADQMTTAISTVAFVAFISQLCDRSHAATHYAALASLGNLARTSLATFSGVMVDGMGGNWSLFFVITTLMVVPSLLLLMWIQRRRLPVLAW